MSSLHPKFSISVYSEGHQFNHEPYDGSRNFAIHTLKREEPSESIVDKFKQSLTKTDWRGLFAAQNGRGLKPQTPTKSEQESPLISPVEIKSADAVHSKLKSKLEKDIELAGHYTHHTNSETKRPPELEIQGKTSERQNVFRTPQAKKTYASVGYSPSPGTGSTKGSKPGRTTKNFIEMRAKTSALQRTLYYDPRTSSIPKTSLKNTVIDDLVSKEDMIMTNPELLQSILKLRDMDLLKQNSPGINKYKGVGKVNFVMNDYHSRSTNPGYSRNTGGNYFCR